MTALILNDMYYGFNGVVGTTISKLSFIKPIIMSAIPNFIKVKHLNTAMI